MSGPKRTAFQREYDYQLITQLYVKGMFQSEIAEKLGLSQGQVSQDIKAIQARWRKNTEHNLDEHKAVELAKLDELERTAWNAWERSTAERTKKRTLTKGERNEDGQIVGSGGSVDVEQRDGNPAFLETVLKCIDRRVKILGLDAPVKGENTDTVTFKVVYGEE
jgi:DNA-binding MarR family transcriptional regulator